MKHKGTLRKGELDVLCEAVCLGMDHDELKEVCNSAVSPILLSNVINKDGNNPLHLCVQRVFMQRQVCSVSYVYIYLYSNVFNEC